MVVRGATCLVAALAATAALASPAEDRAADSGFDIRVRDTATTAAVGTMLKGAAAQLEAPQCRRIFSAFRDRAGRTLQANLDDLGVDASSYLGQVIFHDGRDHGACQESTTLAFTYVGSRVVWICPAQFRAAAWRSRSNTEATLIHEVLHTLGLGENPPSSLEITSRVVAACCP